MVNKDLQIDIFCELLYYENKNPFNLTQMKLLVIFKNFPAN